MVKPENEEEEITEGIKSVNGVLRALTSGGKLSFVIDEEGELIINSNSEELAYGYLTAEMIGMKPSVVRDGVTDFEQIDGQKYFCVSKKAKNGCYIFICTPNGILYRNSYLYGFVCAAGFVFVLLLVCLYLLHGYNHKMIDQIEEQEKQKETTADTEHADASASEDGLLKRIVSHIRHVIGNATPERKAAVVA